MAEKDDIREPGCLVETENESEDQDQREIRAQETNSRGSGKENMLDFRHFA